MLVVTIVNGVNNDQVGDIVELRASRTSTRSPSSPSSRSRFTGRDEDIDDETRAKQRYTLSHLAHDVKAQTGIGEPMRDWYPALGVGAVLGPEGPARRPRVRVGLVQVRLPPQLRHRHADARRARRRRRPSPSRRSWTSTACSTDIKVITDAGRRKTWTALQMGLAVLRNLRPEGVPVGPVAVEGRADHGRPHRRQARRRREEAPLDGASSSSAGCGSRTSSTTTSAAPRCASSRTPRRWARSPSARTTRASAGARSSRRCSRRRRSPSGTRRRAATRSTPAVATSPCRFSRGRPCRCFRRCRRRRRRPRWPPAECFRSMPPRG